MSALTTDPLDHDPITVTVKWERTDSVTSLVEVDLGDIRAWWKECHEEDGNASLADWATRPVTGADVAEFWRSGADPECWVDEAESRIEDESPDDTDLIYVQTPEEIL